MWKQKNRVKPLHSTLLENLDINLNILVFLFTYEFTSFKRVIKHPTFFFQCCSAVFFCASVKRKIISSNACKKIVYKPWSNTTRKEEVQSARCVHTLLNINPCGSWLYTVTLYSLIFPPPSVNCQASDSLRVTRQGPFHGAWSFGLFSKARLLM